MAASGTALATGIGAVPVFFLGERAAALRPALFGITAGAMGVASVVGLILPALDEGSTLSVTGGLGAGVVFLLVTARVVRRGDVVEERRARDVRTALLVFIVLLVHSLPEGFAIGTAWASDTEGLSLFVVLAIALQNIPEGTSVAIPMAAAGFSHAHQFWAAVATSLPQPVGALIAFLLVEQIEALLPISFGFAAGAMLALIVFEVAPDAYGRGRWSPGLAGTALGAGVVFALSVALGVG